MILGGTIRLNRTRVCIFLSLCLILLFYVTSSRNKMNKPGDQVKSLSLRNILYGAIETAQRGGREIVYLKEPLDIHSKGKTKEGVNDSVTNADVKSHCVMYNTLKQTFPQIRIISEEEQKCQHVENLKLDLVLDEKIGRVYDTMVPADDVTVWIDPLDATKEYTEKLVKFVTTMVCVAVKGKPVIGVIHKPFMNVTSWAWVDHIYSDNLNIPPDDGTIKPKIIISMSHTGEVKQMIKNAFGDDASIISAAGAGYKSLEVASGKATAYMHTTSIKKWDICAGNAILNALGGKMTTGFNDEIDYSNTGTGKVVNDKGLLGTIHNHDWYIDKLFKQKSQ